jgi:hypothetical protein
MFQPFYVILGSISNNITTVATLDNTLKKILRGFSLLANCTDRAIAAGQRS